MKIRSGFVSNSSTTSFTIMGLCLDSSHWKEDAFSEEELEDGISEVLYGMFGFDGPLEYYSGPDGDDSMWIGLEIGKMRDDEIKNQFKERAEKLIKEKLGDKIKDEVFVKKNVDFMTEGWRDG